MVFQKHLKRHTTGHRDMHDLTDSVGEIVSLSRVRTGLVHVFHVGSTAAIGTIEFEPGLQKDLPEQMDRLMPPGKEYAHEQTWHDGNAHSHLQATLLGASVFIPVDNGCLVLGTWQQIVLIECDMKARERTIVVTVMGQ